MDQEPEPVPEEESESESELGEDNEDELPEAGELSPISQNIDWMQDHVSLSGSGQTVTDAFEASYFVTFVYEHNGLRNFIIELVNDDTGERENILVNEIGTVSGAVGVGLPEANYFLDIDADGDWSIDFGEPWAPEGEWGVSPATISGEQNDAFGEVDIDSQVTFSGDHEGQSNFIVFAWEEMNTGPFPDEIIFNEISQFEGETSVQLYGIFYISVEADSPYHIKIE